MKKNDSPLYFISKHTSAEVDSIEIGTLLVLIFYRTPSLFQRKSIGSVIRYAMVSFFTLALYVILATLFFFAIVVLK